MTVSNVARMNVKAVNRVFGEGIIEPAEAPSWDRPESSFWTRSLPWVVDVTSALRSEAYTPVAIGAALAWVESRGKIDGCPVIEVQDWPIVNDILVSRGVIKTAAAPAKLAALGPTADELAALDRRRRCFEPDPVDVAWLNAMNAPINGFRFAPATPEHEVDRHFGVGYWTDDDARVHGAYHG